MPDAYIPTVTEKASSAAKKKVREFITPTAPESLAPTTPTTAPARPTNPYAAAASPASANPAPQATPPTPQSEPRTTPLKAPSRIAPAVAALDDIRERRPGLISTVLLWVGAVFGVLAVLVGATAFGDSVIYALGMLFFGAAITLACGWVLRCRNQEKKDLTAWEDEAARNQQLASLLTPEDAMVSAGLSPEPRPAPVPRQWKKVGTVAVILGVIGLALVGAGADEYAESTGQTVGSSPTAP